MVTLLAALTSVQQNMPARIPEPTDVALFALAVAGLIIGRQTSRRRPKDSDTDA